MGLRIIRKEFPQSPNFELLKQNLLTVETRRWSALTGRPIDEKAFYDKLCDVEKRFANPSSAKDLVNSIEAEVRKDHGKLRQTTLNALVVIDLLKQ